MSQQVSSKFVFFEINNCTETGIMSLFREKGNISMEYPFEIF